MYEAVHRQQPAEGVLQAGSRLFQAVKQLQKATAPLTAGDQLILRLHHLCMEAPNITKIEVVQTCQMGALGSSSY